MALSLAARVNKEAMIVKKKARKSARRKTTPGSALQGLVIDYLAARRIRVRRNNVGVAKFGPRFVSYGEPGESDLTAYVPTGDHNLRSFFILNIEIKAGKDRQSYEQKVWQAGVEASGEYYLIVRSLEDLTKWLDGEGW